MVCKLADRQSVYHPCVDDLRVQKGLATRERLVAVAGSLFGAYGYEGTSIEAILEAAGLKRGALYHHFDSKKALFDAALDRAIARIADVVAAAARRAGPDPVAALRAGCTAWLELAMDPAGAHGAGVADRAGLARGEGGRSAGRVGVGDVRPRSAVVASVG
jgi:AcrR family transcriptional regulator